MGIIQQCLKCLKYFLDRACEQEKIQKVFNVFDKNQDGYFIFHLFQLESLNT